MYYPLLRGEVSSSLDSLLSSRNSIYQYTSSITCRLSIDSVVKTRMYAATPDAPCKSGFRALQQTRNTRLESSMYMDGLENIVYRRAKQYSFERYEGARV